MTTRAQVRSALIDAIKEAQQNSGDPVPVITDDTEPLSDLAGFDSLRCVEVEMTVSEKLERELEDIAFKDRGRGTPLRIREIVDQLLESLGGEERLEK